MTLTLNDSLQWDYFCWFGYYEGFTERNIGTFWTKLFLWDQMHWKFSLTRQATKLWGQVHKKLFFSCVCISLFFLSFLFWGGYLYSRKQGSVSGSSSSSSASSFVFSKWSFIVRNRCHLAMHLWIQACFPVAQWQCHVFLTKSNITIILPNWLQ